MVGLATRASKTIYTNTGWLIWGKRKHKDGENCWCSGTEITQVSQEKILTTDTESDIAIDAGNLFRYFMVRTILHRRRPGPCSILWMCPLSPARRGQRKKSDGLRSTSLMKILKATMRSIRRRLRSSEIRLSWRSLSSYGMRQRSLTNRVARRWIVF